MNQPRQMTRPFALSPAQQRHVEKLARDAGRSAGETLRFVLRDGFEFCEWEVRESRAADVEAGRRSAGLPASSELRFARWFLEEVCLELISK